MLVWDGWLKLGAVVAAAGVLGGLWFTAGTLVVTNKQYGITERTEVTNRFAQAITQLGNESVDVRLGAIYQLERLTIDSPRDRQVIFETISAYIRTHAQRRPECRPDDQSEARLKKPPEDVQSALTVIGRRSKDSLDNIDLSRTCLVGAKLIGANLDGLVVRDADLSYADLRGAFMYRSEISRSSLDGVVFGNANLRAARITNSSMVRTVFTKADLTYAFIDRVDLNGSAFADTIFLGASIFNCTQLAGARLERNELSRIIFGDVLYGPSTTWPKDFKPPPLGPGCEYS
ncbi:pentapeptide repeat-containing protein [Nocardia sp. CS682]|uniref:pentapeptide repeat-containing protein n=1 Tax=Nocardia sp. CS682 TaxID=1047172 RepID=UPI001074E4D7|nr:pentapeptide repeat-containing protein [Nocardia sp. CS682]QBS43855.1 hypothetical protein DMB37_30930 [Nocardia sp. CS682]